MIRVHQFVFFTLLEIWILHSLFIGFYFIQFCFFKPFVLHVWHLITVCACVVCSCISSLALVLKPGLIPRHCVVSQFSSWLKPWTDSAIVCHFAADSWWIGLLGMVIIHTPKFKTNWIWDLHTSSQICAATSVLVSFCVYLASGWFQMFDNHMVGALNLGASNTSAKSTTLETWV